MASSSSDFFGELPPQRRRSMSDAAIEYTFVQRKFPSPTFTSTIPVMFPVVGHRLGGVLTQRTTRPTSTLPLIFHALVCLPRVCFFKTRVAIDEKRCTYLPSCAFPPISLHPSFMPHHGSFPPSFLGIAVAIQPYWCFTMLILSSNRSRTHRGSSLGTHRSSSLGAHRSSFLGAHRGSPLRSPSYRRSQCRSSTS